MGREDQNTLLTKAKVEDFINTSNLSIEEIEIAIKNIKQKQNTTQIDLKVTLELSKEDIVDLIVGSTNNKALSFNYMFELETKKYGHYSDAHGWERDSVFMKKDPIEYLLELYENIKKDIIEEKKK